jgi:GDP-D-mannose dehydratase
MKVLITGADGFVGGYLFDHLSSLEYEVFGTYFLREIKSPNHLYLDITDKESALRCISKIKPDIIYHLAGFSSVGKSFEQPKLCYDVK